MKGAQEVLFAVVFWMQPADQSVAAEKRTPAERTNYYKDIVRQLRERSRRGNPQSKESLAR